MKGWRATLGRGLRAVYRRVPLGPYRRWQLKSLAYRCLGPLIEDTASYRHWRESMRQGPGRSHEGMLPIDPPSLIPLLASGWMEAAGRLVLPSAPDPMVSILIPVHDQVRFTLGCLQSIAARPPQVSIEIILIDDASGDDTPAVLDAVSGIRCVRNPTNLGFTRSINRAAAEARGRYLHLLNNDTQVQDGWLDALLAPFVEEMDVGLVGSQLRYPNGALQEAGCALKRDGRVELIGLDDAPSRAIYQRRREVDHCSAASLLIERALFKRLGGFDEVYSPAYYEDADLSLRVRAAGLKVIYEPESVVVHHLSVSTGGRDQGESAGGRTLTKDARIAANRAVFLARWREELAELDRVRAIAFYLPQFHPIPENDRWWGRGFTEWTNVARAKPCFPGHDQPRLPADLGFYDLRLPEVRRAQAELARAHGLYGFCYYYYWFSGRRLLQRPLDEVLASGEPSFPFCICWANESWSRRWDGQEQDLLLAQEHSPEDDRAFIRHLIPLLRDPRYIRVRARPLILVYRTDLLPDAAGTASRWREECRASGIGEVYLASVQSFGTTADPRVYGFDAAVEFPPHGPSILARPRSPRARGAFKGLFFDYPATARQHMEAALPAYRLFRTAMPTWDNTPRRGAHGHLFLDASPEAFGEWVQHLVAQTRQLYPPDERFIFINAWNEWAEGNYLEPDQRLGHAYLEALREALGDPACAPLPP